MKRPSLLLAALFFALPAFAEPVAASVETLVGLPYKSGAGLSAHETERGQLDLYLPAGRSGFSTVVWFHGGGLKTNDPEEQKRTATLGRFFAARGIALAAPLYRLSPKTPFPGYVEDAAAAVAWVHAHIGEHRGEAGKIFVAGHSAGGYLAAMLGMDVRFLKKHGLEPATIAGLIPVSGQMMTHYTVREERGLGRNTVIADEAAPIYYTRQDTPPMLVLYADKDMASRAEENAYFVAAQKMAGNVGVTGLLITDRSHVSIAGKIAEPGDPAGTAILEFIERLAKQRGEKP